MPMAKANQAAKPDKQRKHIFSKEERTEWRNLNVNLDSFCDHWALIQPEFAEVFRHFPQIYQEHICKSFLLLRKYPDQPWDELLFSNTREAIKLYCIWKFASVDPLCFTRTYGIRQLRKNKTNMPGLISRLTEEFVKQDLRRAFMHLQIKKAGHARYSYDFVIKNSEKGKNIDFIAAEKIMHALTSHLRKTEGKKYCLRFFDKIDKGYYFLLLKETNDRVYPAIPDNLRVVSGRYLLVSIQTDTKVLQVHSQIFREASRIRNYVAKRTGIKMRPSRKTAEHNPEDFFRMLLDREQSSEFTLVNAVINKHNMGDNVIYIRDRQKKNDIIDFLQKLKVDGYLELKSFAEFKSFEFEYAGLRYHIHIEEDRWGQIKLEVADRGKPAFELAGFIRDFETVFGIPLQTSLRNQNASINKSIIIQKLLDKPTIESYLPDEVDRLLVQLIHAKIVAQPTTSVKRRCRGCYKVYWKEGSCPECGTNGFYFEGEYKDLDIRTEPVLDLLAEHLKSDVSLKVKKVKHQIESTVFKFLELLNDEGKSLTIYVSRGNVSQRVLSQYAKTGKPLLVIIVKYAPALRQQVSYNDFECLDFATCFARIDSGDMVVNIKEAIQSQHSKWKEKISRKGYQSYKAYTGRNVNTYHDQDFEIDIYNMFHEIFLVGDRLGGNFAGIPAPDGIVSIQDYGDPLSRFCLAWDCKYSVSKLGYRLTDPPKKHRRYIHSLKENDKVLFYGGLKTYLIISQHMHMGTYEKFYIGLTTKFRWMGQVIFMPADLVTRIYEAYRDNQMLIAAHPNVFYAPLSQLFRKTDRCDSIPYRQLTARKVDEILESIKTSFKPLNRPFVFTRKEFTK